MGMYSNISMDKMPKQGNFLNRKVLVSFHYDSSKTIKGVIVRDDMEARMIGDTEREGLTSIQLEDGRYVLTTECHYQPLPEESVEEEAALDDATLDDPQSLAYDLANSPFYGIAPTEGEGDREEAGEGENGGER